MMVERYVLGVLSFTQAEAHNKTAKRVCLQGSLSSPRPASSFSYFTSIVLPLTFSSKLGRAPHARRTRAGRCTPPTGSSARPFHRLGRNHFHCAWLGESWLLGDPVLGRSYALVRRSLPPLCNELIIYQLPVAPVLTLLSLHGTLLTFSYLRFPIAHSFPNAQEDNTRRLQPWWYQRDWPDSQLPVPLWSHRSRHPEKCLYQKVLCKAWRGRPGTRVL